MNHERIYRVSELNQEAKRLLEEEIGPVWLRGEVSNLTRAASGHLYFTLKDETSEIRAVRFRGRAELIPAPPLADGMEVIAYGRLTIYAPRGRYQFVATIVQPAGMGALQAEFERLKAKLNAEGLFAPDHKQSLPQFPRRIGVITSPTGAAIRDIISVLARRWPLITVYLFPAQVQGTQAPEEIVAGIDRARAFSRTVDPLDILIIGRGGGSLEDLASFNNEQVARAIFACEIPVISAVGHEIDFTITDFVADRRAPTPSAAAEIAVPAKDDVVSAVTTAALRALRAVRRHVDRRDAALTGTLKGYIFRIPVHELETRFQQLDLRMNALTRGIRDAYLSRVRNRDRLADRLRLVDPRLPLKRGYSVTRRVGDTTPLRDAAEVDVNAAIETILARGKLISAVKEVSRDDR